MKTPPLEKIYEAWSAAASGRVRVEKNDGDSGLAFVTSSDGEKVYSVAWRENDWSSNDPATWWQGDPGYPVIAVMFLIGRLPYDKEIATLFAGVNWNALNKKYKKNYAAAAFAAMRDLDMSTQTRELAVKTASVAYEALMASHIVVRRFSQKRAS